MTYLRYNSSRCLLVTPCKIAPNSFSKARDSCPVLLEKRYQVRFGVSAD